MDSEYGVIYKTYNDINGDTYIGQTTRKGNDLEWYLGSGKHLKRAVLKYGRAHFYKEILCYCDDKNKLDRMERLYISLLKPEYNIDLGGHTVGKHSQETKEKISAITKSHWTEERRVAQSKMSKGRRASQETKLKQSISHLGLHNHLGYKHSPASRAKMSASQRANPRSHRVRCIETGIEYACPSEANNILHIGNVDKACKGQFHTAGGYHWEYADTPPNTIKDENGE